MTVNLFNTMTKRKEELTERERVTLYTCGPTVYLDPHIGNWRTFIFYDTLVRVLKLAGKDVQHVINITDVGHLVSDGDTGEDKMSKTAKSQRKTAWEIAEQYTNQFIEGMQALNMLKPNKMPKATDCIQSQITMVKELEEKGHTYTISDGIYFDTASISDYGKLAGGVKADDDFARINKNDEKRNPEDFALWKFSPTNEKRDMEWDSPWGVGFPGWHIECSAMARQFLGDTIDIHAGGVDHIPVHHTNEIAQSETATGKPFADIWLHAEFMMVEGAKMSKSKGNFYTLSDIQKNGFTPLDFRMLILQGHYRTETNFSWENMTSASNRLHKLRRASELRWQPVDNGTASAETFHELETALLNSLYDDINTPAALEVLSKAVSEAEKGISKPAMQAYIELLQTAEKAFGLRLLNDTPDLDDEGKVLLSKRAAARANKDYDASDEIRQQLLDRGIEVSDGPYGQLWNRLSSASV